MISSIRLPCQVESPVLDKFVKTVDLKLDNETAGPGHFGSVFQYCNDIEKLAYFNAITRSIKYFDLETGESVDETELARQGPNAVPGDPVYFHYHNKDSIFVFSEFQNSRLFLVNSRGLKINTFNFSSDDAYRTVPFPRLGKVSGAIAVRKNHFYLAFNIADQKSRNRVSPVLRYNMKTDFFEYLKEPQGYSGLDLDRVPKTGQYQFYESRVAIAGNPGALLTNFPLDHNLYLNQDGKVRKINARSDHIDDFAFLSRDKNKYDLKNIEYKTVVFGSARYFGIYYDKKRELYYRLAKLGNTEEWKSKFLSGSEEPVVKEYSLIILDSTLNKLSEVKFNVEEALPEKGNFLGPDGFWVLLPDNGDEDVMTVGLLKTNE